MATSPPNQAPPQYSPDGRWWWDGQRWIPVPQPTPGLSGTAPVEHKGPATTALRVPVRLSDFERILVIVRGVARFLFLAELLLVALLDLLGFLLIFSKPGAINVPLGPLLLFALILIVLAMLQASAGSISRDVFVNATPERVFALVADPQRAMRYISTRQARYKGIETTEPAALGGTKGRFRLTVLGLPAEHSWETLEYEPPRRVVTFVRTKFIGVTTTGLNSCSIEPADGGVRVRLEEAYHSVGWGPSRPPSTKRVARATDRLLAGLKSEAETPQPDGPSA